MTFYYTFVIVIILIILSYKVGQRTTETGLLQGFWETDDEFNSESGLHSFTFYIGDKQEEKYNSYILMVETETNILINEPVTFNLTESYIDALPFQEYRTYYIKFNNLETNLIPESVSMKHYPKTGKLILYNHNKVYAVFFKNAFLTEMDAAKKETDGKNNTTQIKNIEPPVNDDFD